MMGRLGKDVTPAFDPVGGSTAAAVTYGSDFVCRKAFVDQFVDGILRVLGA